MRGRGNHGRAPEASFAAIGFLIGLTMTVSLAAPALGDPPPTPYPDLKQYTKIDYERFTIPVYPGVYFSSPFGLNCGIDYYGAFECDGNIPDAPPGTNQIGWFIGDSSVHYDVKEEPPLPPGSHPILPPSTYIKYRGTSCATTPDTSVYCIRTAGYEFIVSPTHSWYGLRT